MKGDGLKVLRGERQQELQKRIATVKASIAEQKKDNRHMEEEVCLQNDRQNIIASEEHQILSIA